MVNVGVFDLTRECVRQIKPYSPGRSAPDAVKLASNENPYGPSPRAVEAMRDALEDVRLYPDMQCTRLTEALAAHWELPPENVLVGRGSDEIIHMLGLAFLSPGDEVIMPGLPFALYPFTALIMDCRQVVVPLVDFRQNLAAMAAAVTERTKIMFVCSPHNPTGSIARRDEVAQLMEALPEHVILVMDEAYYEYVDDPEYPDMREYIRQGRNVICLRTFSKIYALAGLRLGYGLAPREIIDACRLVREPFNVGLLSEIAGLASLADPEQVARTKQRNQEAKEYLCREFDRLGLSYVPSHANFIFVDTGVPSPELYERLLKRGFTVRTGDIWGTPNHIRVTTGTPEQNRGFIRALEAALRE